MISPRWWSASVRSDPKRRSARFALIGEADRKALREYGGVGEMLCNVYDREGRIVEHPLNQRVMSVPIESVRATPIRMLAAGGAHKQAAIRARSNCSSRRHSSLTRRSRGG
jgi:DNA-binding transcriptional regulator LsrR (DeoR family)